MYSQDLTWVCAHLPAAASERTTVVRLGSEACWDSPSLARRPAGCLPLSPAPSHPALSPCPSHPPSAAPCARPGGCRSVSSDREQPGGVLRSESAGGRRDYQTVKNNSSSCHKHQTRLTPVDYVNMWGAYCCLVSANTEYKRNIFTFVNYKEPPGGKATAHNKTLRCQHGEFKLYFRGFHPPTGQQEV